MISKIACAACRQDRLDLWQFHEINYDNDPDWIFERGAMRAALEARQAGKVRFIGFTGHKDPRIHLKMLRKPHQWDVSLMRSTPWTLCIAASWKRWFRVCHEMGVAPMGMKGLGGGYPQGMLVEQGILTAEEGYRFALSQPIASQVMASNPSNSCGKISPSCALLSP